MEIGKSDHMAGKARETAEKKKDDSIWETVKIIVQALIIAFLIRLFLAQPFNIPTQSMVPTLLVGDYLFVNKLSYGYGPYSFNFRIGLGGHEFFAVTSAPIKERIFEFGKPKRGDVVVFKVPSDNRTDYIKRVIGLPGDTIQVQNGVLILNGKPVKRERIADYLTTSADYDSSQPGIIRIQQFRETLPNGATYVTHNLSDNNGNGADNTKVFKVPPGHYFMMGDNRDDSADSRFAYPVGFVPYRNIVGRAMFRFFSHNNNTQLLQFWTWPTGIRWSRMFTWIHE